MSTILSLLFVLLLILFVVQLVRAVGTSRRIKANDAKLEDIGRRMKEAKRLIDEYERGQP